MNRSGLRLGHGGVWLYSTHPAPPMENPWWVRLSSPGNRGGWRSQRGSGSSRDTPWHFPHLHYQPRWVTLWGESQSAGISAYQKCLGFELAILHVIKAVLSLGFSHEKFQYFTMCFPSESSQKIKILTFLLLLLVFFHGKGNSKQSPLGNVKCLTFFVQIYLPI